MNVPEKIARLVAERGWNQDEFAQRAGIARTTARGILTHPERDLRNATLRRCADALGLSVNDLVSLPLDRLLPRVRHAPAGPPAPLDFSDQPLLQHWLADHPERAARLSQAELEELISLQGVGGPLTLHGIEHFVNLIERRRELLRRVEIIAGTELLDVLEKLVELMWEHIQPPGAGR